MESNSLEVRLEEAGTIIRLRGNWVAKENIPSGSSLGFLPAGQRPSSGRYSYMLNASDTTVKRLFVAASGQITYVGSEILKGQEVTVEGATFVK